MTCQGFNTAAAKTAFIATVAQTLNISPTSVHVVAVLCNNGRRRLSTASGHSVTVIYSVSYDTVNSVEEQQAVLSGSVTSGAFTSALRVNAASSGATELQSAISTAVSGMAVVECIVFRCIMSILMTYFCFHFCSGRYYSEGISLSSSIFRSFHRAVYNS